MYIGIGHWCFKRNTDYYKLNIQMNEGGKYITFGLLLWNSEVQAIVTTKGMIRLWVFGKEFIHWFKK